MAKRICSDCPAHLPKVQGFGNRDHPPIAFIGESPGVNEVNEGRAFSPRGKSGELLHKTLIGLGADPKQMYFDNTTMCPSSGNPSAARVHACYDGLMDTLEEIKPTLIVPMGNVAVKAIGQYERGISFVRGTYRILELGSHTAGILPTYHPAGVLRNPDLFRDLQFDLERALRIAVDGKPAIIPTPYENYECVRTQEQLDAVFPLWEARRWLGVDIETSSRYPYDGEIFLLGIAYADGHASSVDFKLFENNKANMKRLRILLKTHSCIFQSAGFDLAWLWTRGIYPKLKFDTEVAHWLMDERELGHGLESMAMQYLSAPAWKAHFRRRIGLNAYVTSQDQFGAAFNAAPQKTMMLYNAADSDYTRELWKLFKKEIDEQDMWRIMDLIMDATKLYAELYLEGLDVDMDNLAALEAKYQKQSDEAEAVLNSIAPDVNPRSSKQLSTFLFDVLKLSPFGMPADGNDLPMTVISECITSVEGEDHEADMHWKTARAAVWSKGGVVEKGSGMSSRCTTAFMMYWLKRQHPYPGALLQYKQAQKRLQTYVNGVKKNIWHDGKIHPRYRLVGVLHGRYRSADPAIHNLPADPDIYNIYKAPAGMAILHSDYKQADLRCLAHLTGDEKLAAWLQTDPHFEVAKIINGMSTERLLALKESNPGEFSRLRIAAKMITFGLLYGRGADSLAPQMGISVQEARTYMKRYWKGLPKVKKWMDSRYQVCIEGGQEYVGPFGNKRRFQLIVSNSHRWRVGSLGVNFPIMSSVNYLTTLAHLGAVHELRAAGIETRVYPHIHDSINVCVPMGDIEEAAILVETAMSEIPPQEGFDGIDWPVDVDVGTHWGSLMPLADFRQKYPVD